MAAETSIENIFREHSISEIESIRDNLASEIVKRTELLKSIVKEKYKDIVETSDAIQSMKINLREVEHSLWKLDKNISNFYINVRDHVKTEIVSVQQSQADSHIGSYDLKSCKQPKVVCLITELTENLASIWEYFDAGNLIDCVTLLQDSLSQLGVDEDKLNSADSQVIVSVKTSLYRAESMIKNSLWHRIQNASPDQIGVIGGSENESLYQMSLDSSLKHIVAELRNDLSDMGYHAQLRRFQAQSIFNVRTNQVENDLERTEMQPTDFVQLPRFISPELSVFLYKTCKVINVIAGFNLNRSSIVSSMRITIDNILRVYNDLVSPVDVLSVGPKRKRALQLYYDLLYIRILLNSTKSIDLIEHLDPEVNNLCTKFEIMLDSIELYTISAALHENVNRLGQSTIRLYGLLIPHLQ